MTHKVNLTLDHAGGVKEKCVTTIDESHKIIKDYDDAKQDFND